MNTVRTIHQPYPGLLSQPQTSDAPANIGLPNPVPNSVMPAYARLPEKPANAKERMRSNWFAQRQLPDGSTRPSRLSHLIKSLLVVSVVAVAIGFVLHFMSVVSGKDTPSTKQFSLDTSSLTSKISHLDSQARISVKTQLNSAKTQVLAVKTATVDSLAKTEAIIPDPQVMNIQLAKSKPTKVKLAKQNKQKLATKASEAKIATQTAQTSSTVAVATPPVVLPADSDLATPAPNDGVQYTKGHYAYGQCTYYVASRRPVPPNWGNARDWLSRAKAAGYLTGDIPVVGAIAQTTAGRYGHVAYVEAVDGDQVHVAEMNYVGWNKVSHRWVKASAFHYIYGPQQ